MKNIIALFALIVVISFNAAAMGNSEAESGRIQENSGNGKVAVFASILPQRYFIERIGGERVSVDVMVKPGQSPETYEPTPDQVIRLGKADLFFTIGVPFEEQFVPSIRNSLKDLAIVDTSEGVEKRLISSHDHDGEDHEDEHESHEDELAGDGHSHDEGSIDPHIWLSPVAVKKQAVNIFDALSEIDPAGRDYYSDNLDSFLEDLDDVHDRLKSSLAPYRGETIFVFHPAFGYFTDEYGLYQEAIETGGKDPAPATLLKIIDRAREEGVKIIFVQPEFPKKSAEAVAQAINGSVVVLNPLNPDYLNNLYFIASEIGKALKQ